jgi:hypothetical protein
MGFHVLRFWNHEVDFEKSVVMDTICATLERRLPPPSPAAPPPPRAGEDQGAPDPSPLAGRVAGEAGRVGLAHECVPTISGSEEENPPPSPAAPPPPRAGEDQGASDPSPLAGRVAGEAGRVGLAHECFPTISGIEQGSPPPSPAAPPPPLAGEDQGGADRFQRVGP